ncbi:hypothetical protein ACQKO5_22075, partial [Novosphingobium subterraneum]|uniref:hypothetical protein n=1 Tax=Novosphingobium subterraneum TaxID=48936 RepID=UPI003D041CF6
MTTSRPSFDPSCNVANRIGIPSPSSFRATSILSEIPKQRRWIDMMASKECDGVGLAGPAVGARWKHL